MIITTNSCLEAFQSNNRRIYLPANDQNHSNNDLFSRMHRHTTHILKAVRKGKHNEIKYHLCMALSWAFSLANRFHFEVAEEMWRRFPGCCPYCLSAPCICKERRANRRKLGKRVNGRRPSALCDWQAMFKKIYPNSLQDQVFHLAEEVGEVDEAIRNYMATHETKWLARITEEVVDAITNMLGVANCLKLNLAEHMVSYFSAGCPKCCREVCNCGYSTDNQPL